ncbi:hypothetical protein JCM8208_005303 [Rhodotorula glutinis]
MPDSAESSCDPSPPTFKRPQPLPVKRHRKRRPAPSPPADLTQWRLVNSAVGVGAAVGALRAGAQEPGAVERPGENAGAPTGEDDVEARRRGLGSASAAAWEGPILWDEPDGEGPGEDWAEGRQDGVDEPLSSLSPLTPSSTSPSRASHRRRSADNDENVPPSTTRTRSPTRRAADHGDAGALPSSLDELYTHVLPKTRRALSRSRASKKRHVWSTSPSPSSSDSDVPAPPKRKKRRIPPTPPDSDDAASSWEEHDLTPPDRTVPLKYPLSRHATQACPAYLGPDFLGANELDALSPRARNKLLHPPFAPRLSFGSSSSPSPALRRSRSRSRRRERGGGRTLLPVGGDSDSGGEGPPRLAVGQAAKGVFLEGVAQTGFAGTSPVQVKLEARRAPVRQRLQSVQDLGARFEERALRDAPREGELRGRARTRTTGAKKPRLWLGREDEAGDVGELDERAAHLYITSARPLPPHRKLGARPHAQPVHFRFAPIRRPPPAQLISLRPAHAEAGSSGAQLDAHEGGTGEAVEKVRSPERAAATAARPSKLRPSSFRFVVGGTRTQPSRDARVVDEEGERDLGGWDGGESTPAPRAGEGPCTPDSNVTPAPHPQSSGDVFLAGHRPLRRMSTYGVSLFPPRHESDPLEDKETPPPRESGPPTLGPVVVGAPATPRSEVRPGQDAHESSHSYRDGHDETPSLPVPARLALDATPPRRDPLALVTPSLSLPPAQQRDLLPYHASLARSPASTSSFDRSVLAALHSTASSPLQAHYPPNLMLLPGMTTRSSSASTTGLALPIPLRTPYASFRYSSPPVVPSVSAVGPTMPEEEDEDEQEAVLLPTERLVADAQEEEEQVPPTSALGPPTPSGAPDQLPSDADVELDAALVDDGDGDEVHYTALAVAKRTRQALGPAGCPAVARAPPPPPRKAQTTAQGVLTPPESTRKPARRGGGTRA